MATAFTLTRERIADKALEKCFVLGAAQVPNSPDRALALETLDLLLKELPIYGYTWPKTGTLSTDILLNDRVADVGFPSDYYGSAQFQKVGEGGGRVPFSLVPLAQWQRLDRYDGADRIINGKFTSNITGWTDDSVGDGAIAHNTTALALNLNQGTTAGNLARATESITTVANTLHELKPKVTTNNVTIRVGTTSGASDVLADTLLLAADLQSRVVFFPTTTTVFVQLESAGAVSTTSTVDEVTGFAFLLGDPFAGYIDSGNRLHYHPIPNRDVLLRMRYARIIDDTIGGQPPDIDQPWILGLAYGVAAEMGDEFGVPDNKIQRYEAKWITARGRGLIANVDQGKIIVEPDDGDPPVATTPTGEQPFRF